MLKYSSYFFCWFFSLVPNTFAALGFVELPSANKRSAYVSCNDSGDYGREIAVIPSSDDQNQCAVITDELRRSPLNSPLSGFRLIGVQVGDVEMEMGRAGADPAVARLSEAIWRNETNTECILAAQLEMRDAPMATGEYFEVNDIAHAGFANKDVAIAYFYKSHSVEGDVNTEVLFRAGRAFTSAITLPGRKDLPSIKNAPPVTASFSSEGVAYSENWIDFTTDVSFKDMDGVTRAHSSIFYIKYACDARDPVSVPNAVRLRTTSPSEQNQFELAVPGLIPADGSVDIF